MIKKISNHSLAMVLALSIVTTAQCWDNKHFVNYTNNALTNTILLTLFYTSSHTALENFGEISDEPSEFFLPLAAAITSGYLGWKKYDYNTPSKDYVSLVKKIANIHTDAFLILSSLIFTQDEPLFSGGTVLAYLAKYALINSPAQENE